LRKIASLSSNKKHFKGAIVKINCKDKRRLADMGIIKGAIIERIKYAPLFDPIEIVVNNSFHLCISVEQAREIYVELIGSTEL